MAKAPGSFRNLLRTEGSLVDDRGQRAERADLAHGLAEHVQQLDPQQPHGREDPEPAAHQPTIGGSNIDVVRRPAANEDTANPLLYGERLFTKASLRILLSDTAADITNLPTVTAGRRRCCSMGTGPRQVPVRHGCLPSDRRDASADRALVGPAPVTATTTAATAAGATTITVTRLPHGFRSLASRRTLPAQIVAQSLRDAWTETTFTGCTVGDHCRVDDIRATAQPSQARRSRWHHAGDSIPTATLAASTAGGRTLTLNAGQPGRPPGRLPQTHSG